MLQNTPIVFLLAVVVLALLVWRLKAAGFRALPWQPVGIGSALFWAGLAVVLIGGFWHSYYNFFVSSWYVFLAPLGALVLYSLIGLLLRWAALRLPGNPLVWFCLLGGLEAIPEHAVGIYRFHILEIPLLEGSSPAAVFIFAYFEYVLYWEIALILAVFIHRSGRFLSPLLRKSSTSSSAHKP